MNKIAVPYVWFLLWAAPTGMPGHEGSDIIQSLNPVRYEIKQSIVVANQDVSQVSFLELNLPIPQDWPEQRIGTVTITGDAPYRVTDVDGLGTVARALYPPNPPEPGQSRTLSISYWVESRELRTDKQKLARMRQFSPYAENDAEYRLYTRREPLLETDDPDLSAAARRLRDEFPNPYRFAEAVYGFVIDRTEYATPTPSQGAAACLKVRKGDCGQYAALFVALCRAGGVPARPIAGRWAEGTDNWHCWAEFQLPGSSWIPVDPTVGDINPENREKYFGNLDSNRLALVKAYNQTFMVDRGSKSLGFMQVGCWIWHPAAGSTGDKINATFHAEGTRLR